MSTSAACGESIIDTFGVKEIFNCGSSLSNIHFDESDNNDNNNNKLLLPKQHQHHLQALLGEGDGDGDGGRHGYGGGNNSNMSSDNSISDVILFDNDGNFHRTQRRRNSDVSGLVAFRRGGGAYDSKSNSSLLTDDDGDDNSMTMTMTAVPKYSKSTSELRKQRRLDRRAEQHFNQPQGATNASWSSKRNNSSADLLAMLPSVGTRNRNNSATDLLAMVQKK